MPRSQPRALGSSEGWEAQRAPVFIYLKGPAFTYTGSDYPQGREEGDAAAWAFDVPEQR